MGGVSGVRPAKVLVLGAGMAGANAAWIAAGMEAEVIVVDKNLDKLRFIDQIHKGRIVTLMSDRLTETRDAKIRRFAPRLIATLGRAIDFCQATLAYGRAAEATPKLREVNLRQLVGEGPAASDSAASAGSTTRSPAATRRTAAASCSDGVSFTTKPAAPASSARRR